MGRKIKFRAWEPIEKAMYKTVAFPTWNGGIEVWENDKPQTKIIELCPIDDDEPTLMQYTGLKDKNGVEIYEGDIIKSTSYNTWLKVEFDKGQYEGKFVAHSSACTGCGVTTISCLDMGFYEVIGNIYQNSELLGGTNG